MGEGNRGERFPWKKKKSPPSKRLHQTKLTTLQECLWIHFPPREKREYSKEGNSAQLARLKTEGQVLDTESKQQKEPHRAKKKVPIGGLSEKEGATFWILIINVEKRKTLERPNWPEGGKGVKEGKEDLGGLTTPFQNYRSS